jgi:hypothetical protein
MLVYCRESSRNLWLNSGIVLIVSTTTVVFVAYKYRFVYMFKHREQNPALICPLFDIHTRFQERITYESRGLFVVHSRTCVLSLHYTRGWLSCIQFGCLEKQYVAPLFRKFCFLGCIEGYEKTSILMLLYAVLLMLPSSCEYCVRKNLFYPCAIC